MGLLETILYADILFFVNFSMDFVSLWLSAVITSRRRSALRMSCASAIGALFGVISVIIPLCSIISYCSAFAVSLLMCFTAFGRMGSFFALLRQGILVWGCGALLGGIMTAFLSMGNTTYTDAASTGKNGTLSLVCALAVCAVYMIIKAVCTVKDAKCATVCAALASREITFKALCDSGNLMRDPLSGDPVILLSRDIASKLCSKKVCDALLTLDTEALARLNISLRIIPHRQDGSDGIIAGFVPDSVYVAVGKKRHRVQCVLAPRDCPRDYYAGFGATIPTSLIP